MQKESDEERAHLNFGPDGVSRREFLEFASAGVIAGALGAALPPVNASAEVKNGIPYRELGRTGERVSLACFQGFDGSSAISMVPPQSSEESTRNAIERQRLSRRHRFTERFCRSKPFHQNVSSCDWYNPGELETRSSELSRPWD